MTKDIVYHLDIKVYLLKTITYHDMQQQITYFIDQVLAKNDAFLTKHNLNCFKHYCFSGFKQVSTDGIYHEGTLNTFSFRCLDKEMADFMEKELPNFTSLTMKGIVCQKKIIKNCFIQKIYLLTPAIIKFEDGYWRKNHTLDEFQERIKINAIRKYKSFTNEEIEETFTFCRNLKLINRVPIKTRYKDINLLGDKFELEITEDENAQKLAYFLLGSGICELNARGFGFVNYKSI